jgi:eukaryotic-like serine/threonine-protein kinase
MPRFLGTNRFMVVCPLGEGGMGQVFEAYDRQHGQACALKVLPAVTPERLLRFKREFRALQDLRHPNLVTLGELVEDRGQWFFTMELVRGVDLLTWVCPGTVELGEPTVSSVTATFDDSAPLAITHEERRRPVHAAPDLERLRDALVQLAHGLAALHDTGKVHRDVKPSNILVAPDGRVVLLDFGVVSDGSADLSSDVAGTLAYMAPEQASNERSTPASDLFAVGVILYRALTGRVPFSDLSLDAVRRRRWFRPRRPRELAPEVPPVFDDLCVDLLAPDAQARPTARELAQRLGATIPPPAADGAVAFVGRRAELARLEGAWARGTGVVVVEGPSGIGKTALVDEFLRRVAFAAEPRPRVLRGRCHEQEGIPFKAVDGIIDALGVLIAAEPGVHAEPEELRALAALFPSLGRLGPVSESLPAADPHERRRAAERALRSILGRLGPLLVAIDDFQWADRDSVALLAALAPLRFLLVLATRGGDGLGGDVDRIQVGPLSSSDARALVEGVVGSEAAGDVAREGAGHPLFLLELARLGPGAQGIVHLDDVLWARVTDLSAEGQRVLALAAVAAGPVAQAVVHRAAGLDLPGFVRAVGELRAAKLVRTAGLLPEDPLETWHDRIRELVVARLSAPARQADHRALAEAYQALRADDVGAIAQHLAGAGELRAAGEQSLLAGDAARQTLAFERAAAHYRRAAEWLPSSLVASRRVLALIAESLADAGLGADAAVAFERAAAAAPAAEAPELLRRAAEHHIRSGRFDQGADALAAVMRRLGVSLPQTSAGAFAGLLLGRAKLRLRGLGFRQRPNPPSIDLLRVDTLWSAAASLGAIDTIRGAECQARQLAAALELGEPFRVARALYGEAIFLATGGPKQEARARELIERGAALAGRVRHPYTDAMHDFAGGILEYECGRYRRGHTLLARAAELFRVCPGAAHDATVSHRFALDCLFYLGELPEAQRLASRLLEDAERRGDLYMAAELQTGIPNLRWLALDDPSGSRQRTEQGIARWSRRGFHLQHYYHLLALAHVDLYLGDVHGAWRCVEEMWPGLRKSFLLEIQAVRTEAWFLRGRVAVAAGQAATAERAAGKLGSDETPAAAGFALAIRAGLACRAGEQRHATELFVRAARALEAADTTLFAVACRRHAARLVGDPIDPHDAAMRERGVVRPERFAALLVPAPGV